MDVGGRAVGYTLVFVQSVRVVGLCISQSAR